MTGAVLAGGIVPLVASGSAAAEGGALYFSEYVEGSSNNKALEIYNGTGAPVDLDAADYSVQMYFNGSPTAGLTIPLEGTVTRGDVHVLAQGSSAPAVLAVADQTNGSGWFNGDDAIVLRRGTTVIDVIGQIGFDPGTEWGTGLASTADNTLRRKATVTQGDSNGSDAFEPAGEWDGFATNSFDGLGGHDGPLAPVDNPPTVIAVEPRDNNREVATSEVVTVTFSEPVTTAVDAFALVCGGTDLELAVSSTDSTTWTLDPVTALPAGAPCMLTVHGDRVVDRDGAPTPMQGSYASGFSTADCAAEFTHTYAIQGAGAATTARGVRTTQGVVVGDYEAASGMGGFYVQDAAGDGNPATSDGLFVYNGYQDEVSIGDLVRVTGTVTERFGQTQLGAFSNAVEVCGARRSVEPADLVLPMSDEDRERFEGMLVELPQTLAVTELYQLGRFGQVTVSADAPYAPESLGGRLPQPTNLVEPGDEARAVQAANRAHAIVIDDAANNQNPDPIRFSRDERELTAETTLRGGDTATGTVGVLTYTWAGNSASPETYRVRPLGALDGHVDFAQVNARSTSPDHVGGDVQVASFNVLNYFNTFEDRDRETELCRGGVAGGAMECRGANSQAELERQAGKIVAAVRGLDADVVGLIEIENDGYGPDSAIADLVDRINSAMGPGTYQYLDVDKQTGQTDALGDDAIKVGMLYKPAVVEPMGKTAVLNTDSFVNGASGAPRNRPALAQSFQEVDGAGVFTAVVNHLKSKGSDCDEDGDPDSGDGQGNCNQTRLESAQELAAWLGGDPTEARDTDVLVMGDLNSYAQEDPVAALRESGYKDLVRRYEGKGAYSYVFDGQWGYLDHALASPHLARQVTGTTTWRINADEPPVLDYNTEFKTAWQRESLYAPTPYRSSDHDPVLVGLDLAPGKPGADGKRR